MTKVNRDILNINKPDNRNALIVLSLFVLVVSLYFIPIWHLLPDYTEDISRDTAQICESRGFQHETHYITTPDGYILTISRIINPYVKDRAKLKPILLWHGFQNNANFWLINSMGELTHDGRWREDNNDRPVGNTLGFVLAVQGYDVWIANMRGNMYSLNHTHLTPDDSKYWRFSIDEMIDYDLPAVISHIQKKTSKDELAYIGHSQGTYIMFALLATSPQYSNTIKPFIALSPVPFMGNSTSPLFSLGSYLLPFLRTSETSFLSLGRLQKPLARFCDLNWLTSQLCFGFYHMVLGYQRDQFNLTRTGVYVANFPAGSSSWNAAHLLQSGAANRPQRYDYTLNETNQGKYQSHIPPHYDMTKINSTSIALIYTDNDWLNTLQDVQYLKQHLKVKLLDDYQVPIKNWNHMELVWALEAGQYINPHILDILSLAYPNKQNNNNNVNVKV